MCCVGLYIFWTNLTDKGLVYLSIGADEGIGSCVKHTNQPNEAPNSFHSWHDDTWFDFETICHKMCSH